MAAKRSKGRRIWVPITAERAALAYTQYTTIHASVDTPLAVAKQPLARTVCGSDVHPYVVDVVDHDVVMLMAWPPPPERRCADCCAIIGVPRRPRDGWGSWDTLIDND